MRRREFIQLLAGSAAVGPCAALAQTSSKVYRLGSINPALPLAPHRPISEQF